MYLSIVVLEISRADSPALNEHEFNNKKHAEFGKNKLSDAERQSDAMAVQRAFANTKQVWSTCSTSLRHSFVLFLLNLFNVILCLLALSAG